MADNNQLTQLRKFFSHGSREVTIAEYTQFYKACSSEERVQFLTAMDSWDGVSEFIPLVSQPAVAA